MLDFDNEKALDVFADLMEPFAEILTDEEVKKAFRAETKLKAAKIAIKGHKQAIVQILATLDDVPAEEYKVNVFTLPAKVIELFNDPAIQCLFTSQSQNNQETPSGSATENTEDGAQ